MSSSATAPNGAIARLLEDGYDVVHHTGHLVVRRIPYLVAAGEGDDRKLVVETDGQLILPVNDTDGEITSAISDHQIWFAGKEPVDETGQPLGPMNDGDLGNGLHRNFTMSFKPPGGAYNDIHHKIRAYGRILRDAAATVDPNVTATPGAAFQEVEDDLPFVYRDTNTTRAGLTALNNRFRGQKIAIIGLGGTGSYILDQIAKTCVEKIILIDGDEFENHNAFRAPGAAAKAVLQERRNKAEYFAGEYSRMHTGITAHPEALTTENLHLIQDATFVFLAAADADERPTIMAWLRENDIPFIDVGLGISEADEGLTGLVKVTSYLPGHDITLPTVPATQPGQDDYGSNIQVADLNALNALLAVIRWKKHLRFYAAATSTTETVFKLYLNELRNGVAP
jgi:hypothetical protein